MIVEVTHYYAKPGLAEAVLKQRRLASALRVQLGLPPGRIFTKIDVEGPDVRWECHFEDPAAYERDMALRAQSPEFAAARKTMHSLLDKFERHVQRSCDDD
jgi:hypothetical protein